MEVIESRALAPGHTLHLVRVADRATDASPPHGGGCTLLEARPWATFGRVPRRKPGRDGALLILLFTGGASAADTNSFLGITLGGGKGGSQAAVPMQITILLTLLALLPAAIMSVTPFLRISIVLHFLRQALGTQSTPSNQVLLGLSLFLTMLIVSPLFTQIHDTAWVPMQQGTLTQEQAIEEAGKAAQSLSVKSTPAKRHQAIPSKSHAPAPRTERPRSQGSDSRLHHFRIEDRLSDRRGAVPAISGDRHRGRVGDAVDRHGAVASGDAVGALQRSCCSCWWTGGTC